MMVALRLQASRGRLLGISFASMRSSQTSFRSVQLESDCEGENVSDDEDMGMVKTKNIIFLT